MGETGWLAPAGDAAGLGKVMTRVMRIPLEMLSAMGERARRNVIDRFSMKEVWIGGRDSMRTAQAESQAKALGPGRLSRPDKTFLIEDWIGTCAKGTTPY